MEILIRLPLLLPSITALTVLQTQSAFLRALLSWQEFITRAQNTNTPLN